MPVVLRSAGFRFYFYSDERGEPPHIHVEHSGYDAKLWLDTMSFAYVHGFTTRQQKEIVETVVKHENLIRKAWNDFHSGHR